MGQRCTAAALFDKMEEGKVRGEEVRGQVPRQAPRQAPGAASFPFTRPSGGAFAFAAGGVL